MKLTNITYPTKQMQEDCVENKKKIIERTNPDHSIPYIFGGR